MMLDGFAPLTRICPTARPLGFAHLRRDIRVIRGFLFFWLRLLQ
jgi:hypothetical protein